MANMAQAIRMALHFGEKNLHLQDVFGQDVGPPLGGVFTATQGLKTSWNTPLDERGIVGMAMGIAMAGDRCVAEIQFCDYIFNAMDLLKMVGNTHWVSKGQYHLPLVLMTPVGAGIYGSIYHSHSFDAWATRLPGWKVVMPSTPLDAYGLMISAIQDPNPVLYLPPKALFRVRGKELIPGEPSDSKALRAAIDAPVNPQQRRTWKPQWPTSLEAYKVPIGKAKICQEGRHLSVITYGRHVSMCKEAAQQLASQQSASQQVGYGYTQSMGSVGNMGSVGSMGNMDGMDRRGGMGSIEIIDLRSLYPYDWKCIKKSIEKTRRVLFVNEDTEVTNFGEHLCTRVTQELFYHLLARPYVLAAKNVPGIGLHPNLEQKTVPQVKDIVDVMKSLLKEVP